MTPTDKAGNRQHDKQTCRVTLNTAYIGMSGKVEIIKPKPNV